MEDKKHIDRIFQEKLKDFEAFPEPHVWKGIEEALMKKKKRRIVPLWLQRGSAAAVLLFLISTGFWYFGEDTNPANPVNNTLPGVEEILEETVKSDVKEDTNTDELLQQNNQIQQGETKSGLNANSDKVVRSNGTVTAVNLSDEKNKTNEIGTDGRSEESLAENTKKSLEKDVTNKAKDEKPVKALSDSEKDAIAENQQVDKSDLQITKNDIAEAIEDQRNEDNERATDKSKKWSVGTAVAPVYFNTLSDGSPINASLANNSKETNSSLSYGLKVNYQISDRLSVQSGINNVELAYKTRGVTALVSTSEMQFSVANVTRNIEGINLIAISNSQVAAQTTELSAQRGVVNLRGDLNQSMNYIEIPLEAKYAVLNKKFGVHVVGGLSTYLLYNNEVSLLDQNGSTTLGKASNVNDVNFSGNLGLDLDYKLNKKLFINVSPMFKYQMNTFSENDGGFKPYYLGVYTGLNFRF